MSKPRLHLDEDTSIKALVRALHERDHNVTRTPNEWMALDSETEAEEWIGQVRWLNDWKE